MADIKQITPENFDSIVNDGLPVLVDFWAPWCGPCRSLSPIVDEVADELAGKLAVAKCNVDDNQDLAMKYGVMSIPTLIVFKNGEEIDRSVGALPKARLQKGSCCFRRRRKSSAASVWTGIIAWRPSTTI